MLDHIEAVVETTEGLRIKIEGNPEKVLPFLQKLNDSEPESYTVDINVEAPREPDNKDRIILSLDDLKVGDRVQATVANAGGFPWVREGMQFVVTQTEMDGVHIATEMGDSMELYFTDDEIIEFHQLIHAH